MDIINQARAWLRFFRAHTAILEAPIAILGATLGLTSFWNIEILYWAIFGIIYHYVGYGMNSYLDWKNGFDKDDPNKQHHPLNTGEIQPSQAKIAVMLSFATLFIYGIIISGSNHASLIVLTAMLFTGVAYNYIGKYTQHKYVFAATVHTTVFILPYVTYSSNYNLTFIVLSFAYFIHHVFQIAVSGDVKDLRQDESSFIKNLGMEVVYYPEQLTEDSDRQDKTMVSIRSGVVIFSFGLLALEVIPVIANLILNISESYISVIAILITVPLATSTGYYTTKIIEPGRYERERRVSDMSKRELAGFWTILSSTIPIIGMWAWISITLASILYFLPMSKFMWGNYLKPEV